jgi:hypothetical protein
VDRKKKSDSVMEDDVKEKDDGFPKMMGCLMNFGGMTAHDSKRCQKLTRHEVYAAETTMSAFLRWSESTITFDRSDHLESILQPSRYSLVVNLIIDLKRLTKVLMDGGMSSTSCTLRRLRPWA